MSRYLKIWSIIMINNSQMFILYGGKFLIHCPKHIKLTLFSHKINSFFLAASCLNIFLKIVMLYYSGPQKYYL